MVDINWETTLGSTATRNTGISNDGHQVYDIVINQKNNFAKYIDNTEHTFSRATIKFNGTNRFNTQTSSYFNFVHYLLPLEQALAKCVKDFPRYLRY